MKCDRSVLVDRLTGENYVHYRYKQKTCLSLTEILSYVIKLKLIMPSALFANAWIHEEKLHLLWLILLLMKFDKVMEYCENCAAGPGNICWDGRQLPG